MATDGGTHDTVRVVDPSPVHWLSLAWNTMEAANRVDSDGIGQGALAKDFTWVDDETLEMTMCEAVYQDGERFDAHMFKLGFDKVQEWDKPHPSGAFLDFAKDVTCEVVDAMTVRMRFPGGDSAAIMKLRVMHLPSTRFWREWGFIDPKTGSADGHWSVIGAPGPWGTGPFELKAGTSTLAQRDPEVVMVPNENYRDPSRKPSVRVIYDNAISKADAIKSVATGDGIDIVLDVTTEEAHAFRSGKGRIQAATAKTVLCGVFNANKPNSPWTDVAVRKAANVAIDRRRILDDGAYGYGTIMPAFIAPGRYGADPGMKPYAFAPETAKATFARTGVEQIVIVASPSFEKVAGEIASDLARCGVAAKAVITRDEPPEDWDIKLEWTFDWSPQFPIGVVHREFFGKDGTLRASPEDQAFDALYAKLLRTPKQPAQEEVVRQTERYVHDQAKCLFLYAPHRLFAVSNRVEFVSYDTCVSELAETKIKA